MSVSYLTESQSINDTIQSSAINQVAVIKLEKPVLLLELNELLTHEPFIFWRTGICKNKKNYIAAQLYKK